MDQNQQQGQQYTERDLQLFVSELEDAAKTFSAYHDRMELMRMYYKNSVFRKQSAGQAPVANRLKANLLKTFARKNMLYTSPLPLIKVPTTGADPAQRQAAAIREKILYGVHSMSNTTAMQKKFAFDATIYSVAINETVVDLKQRCVYLKRHNPKRCYWQLSNDSEQRVIAFWSVGSITRDEAMQRYNVLPTSDLLPRTMTSEQPLRNIDGKTWYSDVYRWDGQTRTHWIGNKFAEIPHDHLLGEIPIDVCMPFNDDDNNGNQGAFYLEDLLDLQAELNDTLFRRSAVVRRMSNPSVWARGVRDTKDFDNFKTSMANGTGGGFLSLQKDGDVGILQLNDTSMLDNHKKEIIEDMQRIAGFSAATFGESVGANTSGDALGMYFTPTQKLIDDENISWIAFWQSIHAKILKGYDRMLLPNEKVKLSGYSPRGTLLPVSGDDNSLKYKTTGSFEIEFGREVISGSYGSIVVPRAVTPKNEIEEKRFWKEAAEQKFVSRTTAFEQIELESPEEELELLKAEQSDPFLNPDGIQALLAAAGGGQGQPAGNTALPVGK